MSDQNKKIEVTKYSYLKNVGKIAGVFAAIAGLFAAIAGMIVAVDSAAGTLMKFINDKKK